MRASIGDLRTKSRGARALHPSRLGRCVQEFHSHRRNPYSTRLRLASGATDYLLLSLGKGRWNPASTPDTFSSLYLAKVARLGGYLGRAKDRPPGNMVMWRGLSRLLDIGFGFTRAARFVGNCKD